MAMGAGAAVQPSDARQIEAMVETGIQATAAIEEPADLGEFLASLEDADRCIILRASKRDRTALEATLTTFPIWWPRVPLEIRIKLESDRQLRLVTDRNESRVTRRMVNDFFAQIRDLPHTRLRAPSSWTIVGSTHVHPSCRD